MVNLFLVFMLNLYNAVVAKFHSLFPCKDRLGCYECIQIVVYTFTHIYIYTHIYIHTYTPH